MEDTNPTYTFSQAIKPTSVKVYDAPIVTLTQAPPKGFNFEDSLAGLVNIINPFGGGLYAGKVGDMAVTNVNIPVSEQQKWLDMAMESDYFS